MMVVTSCVLVRPGQCFDYPNFMRIVLTVPFELTEDACNRISNFCARYYVANEVDKKEVDKKDAGSNSHENGHENGF